MKNATVLALCLGIHGSLTAATFTVTTSADTGPGSLREAILEANGHPGSDTIAFAIGDPGSQHVIEPASALPVISDPVLLDGWSQGGPAYAGSPLLEIRGGSAGSHVSGLRITSGHCTVRGLAITGFASGQAAGIRLETGGTNWILGNHIGLDPTGTTRAANAKGIWIEAGSSANRIGTDADGVADAAERNVISGNVQENIAIFGTNSVGNRIMGNFIGLNAAGTAAIGTNSQSVAAIGILIQQAAHNVIGTDGDGQGDALEGNVIAGNTYNIQLAGSPSPSRHNRIAGNRIGTNPDGTVRIGPQSEGVRLVATEEAVIGTDGDGISDALEGNLISGHSDWGVWMSQSAARHNVVAGNRIGTDAAGLLAITNGFGGSPRGGVHFSGAGNRLGSNLDGVGDDLERNLISGNGGNASGVYLQSFQTPDAPTNRIVGNWIGVDATGLSALPNGTGISGGHWVPLVIRDNVISGNRFEGIQGSLHGTVILGNRIGVAADGTTAMGNGYTGIALSGNGTRIGGTGPGEANTIAHNGKVSGNFPNGIRIGAASAGNGIRGNRIFDNGGLGIDLLHPAGVTANDVGDEDSGANGLQNFPVITFARAYTDGTTVIRGTLNSHANTTFQLDFYRTILPDPLNHGEADAYLGDATVTTDAAGDATFDVTLPVTLPPDQHLTATATHPTDGTSEFSATYAAGGLVDIPVEGLSIHYAPPVYAGVPTAFQAGVTLGTGVAYEWSLGDGVVAAGPGVTHTFTNLGTQTVTLTATNNSSTATVSAEVTVLEPANINGYVWLDRDGDGFRGLGEELLPSVPFTVVGLSRQDGPDGPTPFQTVVPTNGLYQFLTPEPGVYSVALLEPPEASIQITNRYSTPNPVIVPMGPDGGTEIHFGIVSVDFPPEPDDDGFIIGRLWIDRDSDLRPEPGEIPVAGRTVRLLNPAGQELSTVTSDPTGYYAFRITEPGLYRVRMEAPPGTFPTSREVEVHVAGRRAESVQMPFFPGNVIGGAVTDAVGAGLGGVRITMEPGGLETYSTAGDGRYQFEVGPFGNYTLRIHPPEQKVPSDGQVYRGVSVGAWGAAVVNWMLLNKGEFSVRSVHEIDGMELPAFMRFNLYTAIDRPVDPATDLFGTQATDPRGEWSATSPTPTGLPLHVLVRPVNVGPAQATTAAFVPTERQSIVLPETASTLSFSLILPRSLNLFATVSGTGFRCGYEVRRGDGFLADSGFLDVDRPAVSLWAKLAAGTYSVTLTPDPTVPGQEGWPPYSQTVAIDTNTHAVVRYPYNPANRQSIEGHAFRDHCWPVGESLSSETCTEDSAPSNNGLLVTLSRPDGTVVATRETTHGAAYSTGHFRFDDLPVGEYVVGIAFPTNYLPTTPVTVPMTLDGIVAPEKLYFGYQAGESPTLSGRAFFDGDANGTFDPAWDDPLPGAVVAIETAAGTPVAQVNTASDGSWLVAGLPPATYTVTLTHPQGTTSRPVTIEHPNSVVFADFPIAPPGVAPRVLVFADINGNGLADPEEQRFGGVTVQLVEGACDDTGTVLGAVQTGIDGRAEFPVPPAGTSPLCARITAGLPTHTVPVHLPGVSVPRNSGMPVPLPVMPSLQEPASEVVGPIAIREDQLSLLIRSIPGQAYTVERTGDLGSWSPVESATPTDLGYSRRLLVPISDPSDQGFYRITSGR